MDQLTHSVHAGSNIVQEAAIVVGAGIAGLAAAHHLAKLGLGVTVLEATARVGGRMSTDKRDGYLIDRGAQFLSTGYAVIADLIADTGLDASHCNATGWSGIVRDGTVRRFNSRCPWSLASSGLLRWPDLVRMARASISLARTTKGLPLSDYSCWHAMDAARASDWVASTFGNDALEYVFEPMLEGFYFQAPEETSRAWAALMWMFGIRRHAVTALAGGMGSLPEALARNLDVRLETPAISIETEPAGVRVATHSGVLHADYLVLATTTSVAKALYSPRNATEERLLETAYSSAINISVATSHGIAAQNAGKDIYGLLVPRRERRAIAAIALESRKCKKYVPQGELLNVMLSGSAAARLMDEPEVDVLAEVLPELETYFPGVTATIKFTQLCRWREAEPRSPVGRSTNVQHYRQLWRPNMRVILAGDYMGTPCTEGAAESGRWAATAIGASPGCNYHAVPRAPRSGANHPHTADGNAAHSG